MRKRLIVCMVWCLLCCALRGAAEEVLPVAGAQEGAGVQVDADTRPEMIQFAVESIFLPGQIASTVQARMEGEKALFFRKAMDADGNGVVNVAESAAYLKTFLQLAGVQVRMRADGAVLDLAPREDPALDLHGELAVVAQPVTLSLFLVAHLPRSVAQPRQLHLDNQLFPEHAARARWEVRRQSLADLALIGTVEEAFVTAGAGSPPRLLSVPLQMQAAPTRQERVPQADATESGSANDAAAKRRAERLRFFSNTPRSVETEE